MDGKAHLAAVSKNWLMLNPGDLEMRTAGDYKKDADRFARDREYSENLNLLADHLRQFGVDLPAHQVIAVLRPRRFRKSTKVRRDSRIVYNVPGQRGAWMSLHKRSFEHGADGAPDVLTAYFGPPALAEVFREPQDRLTDPEWAGWAVQKIQTDSLPRAGCS